MNMQPMKLNNIQTGFKRILLTVATVFMLGNGWAQDAKVLKGRIVNAEGEPIAGAVVNVAEASRIALSDKDGFFTLKNVKPADELYVSSVGYLPTTAIADFEDNSASFQPQTQEVCDRVHLHRHRRRTGKTSGNRFAECVYLHCHRCRDV